MLTYYRYHLKKSLPVLAVSLIVGLLLVNVGLVNTIGWYDSHDTYHFIDFSVISVLYYIEAFVYAYLEFSSFRNKRNLDTWYSFPLSREKIAIVHMLNAFTLFAVQTLVYFVNGAVLIIMFENLNILYFIPAMLIEFVFACLMFSFISCAFLFANTIFDGAVSVIAWINLPVAIYAACSAINSYGRAFDVLNYEYENRFRLNFGKPVELLVDRLAYFINKAEVRRYLRTHDYSYYGGKAEITSKGLASIIIWLVLMVIATVVLPYVFSKRPTEKIGGHSDFILCYDFIIPIYALIYIAVAQQAAVLKLFGVIAAYIAYAIYRKSPNITIKRFVVVGILGVLALIPFLTILGID